MSAYSQPIYTAALVFIVIAFMIFVPWLIYTYRKFGFLSVSTTLIAFSFIFYFLSALFLVLLPLPESRDTCALLSPGAKSYSLMPFQFVKDTLKDSGIILSQPSTYIWALKQSAFQQAFFNFLLLMPFGIYLRYFFQEKKYWARALLLTFGLTLFYETTQATGIYGIYNCAYRIFDVDDLMLNTAGGIFGFFTAPIFLALFPSKAKVEAKANELLEQDEVKPMAILLSLLIDFIVIQFAATLLQLFTPNTGFSSFIVHSIILIAMFFVLPVLWKGNTLGSFIMKFRYDSYMTKAATAKKLAKRTLAIYAVYLVPLILGLLNQIEFPIDSHYYVLTIWMQVGVAAIYFFGSLTLLIHCIVVLASKGKRRFYFDEAADINPTRKG